MFKLGPASRILGVDFRRFQLKGTDDCASAPQSAAAQAGEAGAQEGDGRRRGFTIRLHSDAVIASLTGGVGRDSSETGEGYGFEVKRRPLLTMAPRRGGREQQEPSREAGPACVEVHDLIRGYGYAVRRSALLSLLRRLCLCLSVSVCVSVSSRAPAPCVVHASRQVFEAHRGSTVRFPADKIDDGKPACHCAAPRVIICAARHPRASCCTPQQVVRCDGVVSAACSLTRASLHASECRQYVLRCACAATSPPRAGREGRGAAAGAGASAD